MSTISFSVDEDLKREFVALARKKNMSQSELFRDMYLVKKKNDMFIKTTTALRRKYAGKNSGLKSADDVAEFLRQK